MTETRATRKRAKGARGSSAPGTRASGGAPGRRASAASEAADRRRVVAELRALAHPLRLRLYELFAEQPRTTMQVAEILGEPPTRLYHHVNALEKSGLLRLRETRPNRGTVEKYFEAVKQTQKGVSAETFHSSAARQSARAAAATVFEQGRQDLFAAFHDLPAHGEPAPMLLRMVLKVSQAKAELVRRRLHALVKEIKAECGEETDAAGGAAPVPSDPAHDERWSVTLAFARAWPRRGKRGA